MHFSQTKCDVDTVDIEKDAIIISYL